MSKFKLYLSTLFLASFICVSCGDDQPVDINDTESFNAYLEELMTNQNIPGLAVLIFEGETIKYENYLGKSDIENDKTLTQNDIFLMASVSKMVTATAILKLYEDGEFDLDDPINDYLSFDVNVPNQNTDITFRMLLTHTSAIEDGPNAELFYSYGMDSPLGLDDYMEKYLTPTGQYYDDKANFYNEEPGTTHKYSNMASALMGTLVTQISGVDFKTYCRNNIFTPLGMNDTYWSLDAALNSNKTLVNPYNYSGGDYDSVQHYTFPDYPNGGLRSTPRDMMKFLGALAQEGTYNGHQLLQSSTVNEMLSVQFETSQETLGLHTFLLDKSENVWGHNGSEEGVSTEVGFNPTNNVGVIVLSNLQDVGVSDLLLDAYAFGKDL